MAGNHREVGRNRRLPHVGPAFDRALEFLQSCGGRLQAAPAFGRATSRAYDQHLLMRVGHVGQTNREGPGSLKARHRAA
jgi:hypothetical protein